MTNYQFWKALEETMKEPQNDINILKFSERLIEGYEDNDDPKIWCSFTEDKFGVGTYSQSNLDSPDGKLMLCFTRKEYAEKDNRRLRDEGERNILTKLVSLKEVMDNMFDQSNITGLIFNCDDKKHMYLVTKNLLRIIMRSRKEKISNLL